MIRVPGHVTTIFYPVITDDPSTTGSLGAGFSVSLGSFTEVIPSNALKVFINGLETNDFVSITALRALGVKAYVYHYTEIPLGFGAGMSASCALGAVLEAARVLSIDRDPKELAHYAHIAEVKHKTGLGDVISEFYGGFEIRKKPGSPLTGELIRIDPKGRKVALVVLGELETPKVLSDKEIVSRILKVAERYLDEIKPDPKSIVETGAQFAEESGLIRLAGIDKLYKKLSKEHDLVSMIMLSKGVFVLSRDVEEIISVKEEFGEHARIADVAEGRTFI